MHPALRATGTALAVTALVLGVLAVLSVAAAIWVITAGAALLLRIAARLIP